MTHLKWADTALSAHKMPKHPPRHGCNWGVMVMVLNGEGKPVFDPHGKAQHQTVHMGDAMFVDGGLQCLYFPEDHPVSPGIFKWMAVILEECGYWHLHSRWSARVSSSPKMPLLVVAGTCSTMSQNFLKLNPFWRPPTKPEAFRFYFWTSSTVNSILLNSAGATQKESIDNIPSHPKRMTWSAIFSRCWTLCHWHLCSSLQPNCSTSWMATGSIWMGNMPHGLQNNMGGTESFQRQLWRRLSWNWLIRIPTMYSRAPASIYTKKNSEPKFWLIPMVTWPWWLWMSPTLQVDAVPYSRWS